MIERLLAAESALARGETEAAGLLYAQVADADPRNAIAVVGLARVAVRDGRAADARQLAERALEIDPEEAAAGRLLRELLLDVAPVDVRAVVPEGFVAGDREPVPVMDQVAPPAPPPALPPANPVPAPVRRRSILDRIRRWLGLGGGT